MDERGSYQLRVALPRPACIGSFLSPVAGRPLFTPFSSPRASLRPRPRPPVSPFLPFGYLTPAAAACSAANLVGICSQSQTQLSCRRRLASIQSPFWRALSLAKIHMPLPRCASSNVLVCNRIRITQLKANFCAAAARRRETCRRIPNRPGFVAFSALITP